MFIWSFQGSNGGTRVQIHPERFGKGTEHSSGGSVQDQKLLGKLLNSLITVASLVVAERQLILCCILLEKNPRNLGLEEIQY